MYTKKFWKDASERMVSSAANAVLLAVGANQVNVLDLDAMILLGFAGGGALISFLKALAAAHTGDPESASLVDL